MNFIIAGTSQHFSRLVINIDHYSIGLFDKGFHINLGIRCARVFRDRRLVLIQHSVQRALYPRVLDVVT